MSKRLLLATLLCGLSGTLGCHDDATSENPLELKTQPLIFDDDNIVRQPDVIAEAVASSALPVLNVAEWHETTGLRMTGSLTVELIDENGDEQTSVGSGKLSASNLLLTAAHVAQFSAAVKAPSTPEQFKKNKLSFAHHWFDSDLLDSTDEPTSQFDDWMTRQRLHSLGIHRVIEPFDRRPLQSTFKEYDWKMEVSYESDPATGNQRDEDIDVALVKILPKVIEGPEGTWLLPGAGLIYDRTKPACVNDCPDNTGLELNEDDPLSLYHVNYPTNSAIYRDCVSHGTIADCIEKLLNEKGNSGDGQEDVIIPAHNEDREYQMKGFDGPEYTVSFNRWVVSRQDHFAGSSGGAAHAPNSTANSAAGHWFGVFSQCIGTPCLANINWKNPVHGTTTASDERYTLIAPFDDMVVSDVETKKGNLGNPFYSATPPGVSPPASSFDGCLVTAGTNEAAINECWERYHAALPLDEYGISSESSTTTDVCVGVGCSESGDPSETNRTAGKGYLLTCGTTARRGRGLGLIGAPLPTQGGCVHYEMEASDPSKYLLGQIGLICGPLSQREWSVNWDFLTHSTANRSDDCAHTSTDFVEGGSSGRIQNSKLIDYLPQAFSNHTPKGLIERVLEGGLIEKVMMGLGAQLLSPQPFLMCPPNHVMAGFEYGMHENTFVQGISGLYCLNIHDEPSNQRCVNADGTHKTEYPCFVSAVSTDTGNGWAMTLDESGHPSMRQPEIASYLGQPHREEYTEGGPRQALCPNKEQITGIRVSGESSGPTRFIDLICNPYQIPSP